MTTRTKLRMVLAIAIAGSGFGALLNWSGSVEAAPKLPPATLVEPAAGNREIAVLAGGCFWGVEAVFEHVKGVEDVQSGYSGGDAKSANYAAVSSGRTRHAEAVRISFNPRMVSYAELLRIYFAVAHDPTEVDRQGPDVGPQYRSAIFPQSAAQAKVAKAYIAQLDQARVFPKPIATRLEQGRFVPAETYHQDFVKRNPRHPYILLHDRPKVTALKQQFPMQLKGD